MSNTGELSMNEGKGKMEFVRRYGVTCKRYAGKFHGGNLQDKADVGQWYTMIEGNPFSQEGEGSTPKQAVQDAIKRNLDLIKKLEQANRSLSSQLPSFE